MADPDQKNRLKEVGNEHEAIQRDAEETSLHVDSEDYMTDAGSTNDANQLDTEEPSLESDPEDDLTDTESVDESLDSDSEEDQADPSDLNDSEDLDESHIEIESSDSDSSNDSYPLVRQRKPEPLTEERKMELLQWVPSQKADSDRISMLDISLEIREIIYKEALVCEGSICAREDLLEFSLEFDEAHDSSDSGVDKCRPFTQIFCVCRQLYAECEKVFYSCNRFVGRPQAIHSFRDHEIKFVPSPYNTLVRRVEYGVYWESLQNWPGAFCDHLNKVREWMPATNHVQYKLRWADNLIDLDGNSSPEASLKRTVGLLKCYTLKDQKLPEWLEFSIHGTKEEEKHMAAAMAMWRKKTADSTGLDDEGTP
ncbi:uncharacterized protein BDZ99DRAFT_526116 [Mytilinidion resinicola]|uniref:Uncharacterized protein n=1 Tax=Mytilinidion resinicola TaxID=574789 RepID=A0A6A6Y8D5_9PEZI|nr:uncharacterized protein BDZ99DRAFT_526116 [Mytilinidion resinicola]KAF2804077.1 hypothetical protein BDZ99DRAFT_526116 [Mytilinidion resinicola]